MKAFSVLRVNLTSGDECLTCVSVPHGNVCSFCPSSGRLALGSQPYEKETPLLEQATKASWLSTHQATADWVLDKNEQ